MSNRGVSTARTVLHLLSLLAEADGGMRATEIAKALGKSTSTAYSLLDTLCQEQFVVHGENGTYHLAAEAAALVPRRSPRRLARGLGGVLDELFARTHKRVYLATARSGQVVIPLVRGRQGMPLIPGLGSRIGADAHALALGKIALAELDETRLERYIAHGLRPFTPATIVSPTALREHLVDVRREQLASDREEFAEDHCCLAVPVPAAGRRAVAAIGISMTTRAFDHERDALTQALRDAAAQAARVLGTPAVPAISEDIRVLDRPTRPNLRSALSPATTPST